MMEHFSQLKRRTTDLLQSLPQSLPPIPDLSSPIRARLDAYNTMKGTWQRVDIPPLPRSSHSVDIVAGTAYVFGGEGAAVRQPVDNDMHAIVLPTVSAAADYYVVKAVAANPTPPSVPVVTVAEHVESDPVTISEPTAIEQPTEAEVEAEAYKPAAKPADTGIEEIPLPGPALGDVPAPRVGHATGVIGNRIFVFGGRGGPAMTPLDERGRVWVFDTKTHLWSFLDPQVSPVPAPITVEEAETEAAAAAATAATPATAPAAVSGPVFPPARSYHTGTTISQPASLDDRQARSSRHATSWKEWAEGNTAEVGTPQRPLVGNVAARARDADSDGYGTFFIHGGCLADGTRTNDLWAFDVRTRIWQELPPAPGLPRGGAAFCASGRRLYRFGGFNGSSEEGGRLDFLDLTLTTPDETSAEPVVGAVVTARRGWQSLVPETVVAPPHAKEVTAVGEPDEPEPTAAAAAPDTTADGDAASAAPLIPAAGPVDAWPGNRSVASLEAITVGGGWEYLVLSLGERSPSGAGHEAAGLFWDDVWVFPVLSDHLTAASVSDVVSGVVRHVRNALPHSWFGHAHKGSSGSSAPTTGRGQWSRLVMEPYDDDDAEGEPPGEVEGEGERENVYGPGRRGWLASAPLRELEENAVLLIGGLSEANERLGDAWILRVGGEKRE